MSRKPAVPVLDWQADALCARPEHSRLLWFPDMSLPNQERRKEIHRAQRVCAICPVQAECATFAERSKVTAGIWAGRYYGKSAEE